MPRIRRPPPEGILKHLIDRYRDGRIAFEDFQELKHFLEADVDVPPGMWFKRFRNFTLVGVGELPKTFLTPDMVAKGTEVL